jgi:hypothetical protein
VFCFCNWHFVDLLELMPVGLLEDVLVLPKGEVPLAGLTLVGLLEDVLVLPEGEVPLAGLLPELDATKDATAGPGNE